MKISVIVCTRNEEGFVDACLTSILNAISKHRPYEIYVIADRCTDRTAEKCKRHPVEIVEKRWKHWANSGAESIAMGLELARGKYIALIRMDMTVPSNFFDVLLPMLKGEVACVSPLVVTYPEGLPNKIVHAKEKMYSVAPLGRGTYGIKIVTKQAMDEIKGPRDVWGADTDVDMRLEQKGYKCLFVPSVKVFHHQKMTLRYIISKQLRSGRARRMIKYGFLRTVAHAIFRLRPFVVVGWLIGTKSNMRKHEV